jgi:tripartite-type tricarboxylate transporter receptor subunit TctC
VRASNYLYNVAPKDGSVIALSLDNLPLNAFLAPGEVKYRTEKFNWIGRGDAPVHLLFSWAGSGVETFEDARKRDVLTAVMAPGTSSEMYPALANNLAGARFKLISGYEGSGGVNLALERGEVEAVGANSWINISVTKPDWVRENKIRPLFQIHAERDPVLPNTPTLLELVPDGDAKEMVRFLTRAEEVGLYLIAPPGVPPERVALLRKAFDAMVADPAFVVDAEQSRFEVHPLSGADLQRRAEVVAATPPDIVEKFKRASVVK